MVPGYMNDEIKAGSGLIEASLCDSLKLYRCFSISVRISKRFASNGVSIMLINENVPQTYYILMMLRAFCEGLVNWLSAAIAGGFLRFKMFSMRKNTF